MENSSWKRTDLRSNSRTPRNSQFTAGVYARGASSSSSPIPRPGGSFSPNPQPGGSFFPNPQPGGSFSPILQPGGSFFPNPQPEGSFSQNPQPAGSFSPIPQPGGSFFPNPLPGGSFSQNPQPAGSFSPIPQPGGSFFPSPQPGAEVQMAYEDAWKVCNPDFKTAFTSLEDACERLLPYHVVADYEGEEDGPILAPDSTGQMLSGSQQWDNTLAAKVAQFSATFENQIGTFNALTGVHTEERMMVEQLLLQQERQALLQERAEFASKQKMAAMEQSQAAAAAHAKMFVRSQNASSISPVEEKDTDASDDCFLNDQETYGHAE